jgi:hypothetical protein
VGDAARPPPPEGATVVEVTVVEVEPGGVAVVDVVGATVVDVATVVVVGTIVVDGLVVVLVVDDVSVVVDVVLVDDVLADDVFGDDVLVVVGPVLDDVEMSARAVSAGPTRSAVATKTTRTARAGASASHGSMR